MSKNVTKVDLAAVAAEQAGITKAQAEKIINSLLGTMETALVDGRSFTLVGFGSFGVSVRQARNGRNPQTKKEMKIPASKVVRFKAGKNLKEAVNT